MKDKMMEPEVKIDNGELATSMIPEDFTEPEVLFQKLISMVKKYHPSDDVHLIEKAYKIAYKAHDGQKENRASLISFIRSVSALSLQN